MMHHALATIERGAMGNHALALNDALSSAGIDVETYAETIREEFRNSTHYYTELENALTPESLVVYQLGNDSPVADLLYKTPCRLIVNYHNITPARYFSRWNPPVAAAIGRARAQVARLAEVTTSAIAVSEFNANELRNMGYRNVEVIPPLFNQALMNGIDKSTSHERSNELRLLFVGRIAPHKRQDFLIHVCDVLNKDFGVQTSLTLIGRSDAPSYSSALDDLIIDRHLEDKVTIIDDLSATEIAQHYCQADVFVCASEHEGFCIPLVEAAHADLPIVTRRYGAIGETLAGAGVFVDEDDPKMFAAVILEQYEQNNESAILSKRRHDLVERFDQTNIAARYVDFISKVLS